MSGAPQGAGGGGASSFGQWFEQYNAQQQREQQGDVEEGLISGVGKFFRDRGFGEAQDQASAIANRFVANIRAEDGIVAGAKNTVDATLSYGARLKTFIALLLIGVLFYLLAFFVGLPVIVFRPVKFALCATLGSCFTMGSFSALTGPWAHFQSLMKWERLPFTISYIGSLALTLYASLIARSYLLVILTTSIQIAAFAWYVIAFLPGGPAGLRVLSTVLFRALGTATAGCGRLTKYCFSSIIK